ncbi:MAG: hypothetical protein ABS35_25285 [Kaistia sp. SCN 65-12]|nr:MAG: hypothetical protein ABS35_25285 [Kaistia sp. SCN 65-12]
MTTASVTLEGGGARAALITRHTATTVAIMTASFAVIAGRLIRIEATERAAATVEGRVAQARSRRLVRRSKDRNRFEMAADIGLPSPYAGVRDAALTPIAIRAIAMARARELAK